jgi:hypothetical protein
VVVGSGGQLDVLLEARQQRDTSSTRLGAAGATAARAAPPAAPPGPAPVVPGGGRDDALGQRLALGAGGQRLGQLGMILEVAGDDRVEDGVPRVGREDPRRGLAREAGQRRRQVAWRGLEDRAVAGLGERPGDRGAEERQRVRLRHADGDLRGVEPQRERRDAPAEAAYQRGLAATAEQELDVAPRVVGRLAEPGRQRAARPIVGNAYARCVRSTARRRRRARAVPRGA